MITGTTEKEDESFENVKTLLISCNSMMILFCIMEVLMYFLYNNKVWLH